jgi:hypothetical protein
MPAAAAQLARQRLDRQPAARLHEPPPRPHGVRRGPTRRGHPRSDEVLEDREALGPAGGLGQALHGSAAARSPSRSSSATQRPASSCIATPKSAWAPSGVRSSCMQCASPPCSTIAGPSCRPAAKERRRSPGPSGRSGSSSRQSVSKLRITGTAGYAASRRRSGPDVRSAKPSQRTTYSRSPGGGSRVTSSVTTGGAYRPAAGSRGAGEPCKRRGPGSSRCRRSCATVPARSGDHNGGGLQWV